MKKSLLTCLVLSALSLPSFATEVDIQTSLGNIRVDLNEQAAPNTVKNFLQYVSTIAVLAYLQRMQGLHS